MSFSALCLNPKKTDQAPATGRIPVPPMSLVCWELGVATCPRAAARPYQLELIKPAHLTPIWSSTSPPSSSIKGRLVRPLVARVSICCSGACQSGFLEFSQLKWIFFVNSGSVLFVSCLLDVPHQPLLPSSCLYRRLSKPFFNHPTKFSVTVVLCSLGPNNCAQTLIELFISHPATLNPDCHDVLWDWTVLCNSTVFKSVLSCRSFWKNFKCLFLWNPPATWGSCKV